VADREFIMKLARLVIAAAWADGEIRNEEMNALKDLIFSLPEITGADWAKLEIYLDHPVDAAEARRLLDDVLEGMRSQDDKAMVLDTLRKLAESDGHVSGEEAALLEEVAKAVEAKDAGLLTRLTRLIRGATLKRSSASASGPNRENRIDDFIRNAIYFQLVSEREARGAGLDAPEETIRKLCLAAGLMAKVAWVDEDISSEEKDAIRRALRETWRLSEAEASLVCDISTSRVIKGLDDYRLVRSFYECTTNDERASFMKCLFQVANASEKTSHEEIEQIRNIALGLKLSHREFINAKLTVPKEDRRGL